ncbi:hypothetical protein [Parafilimonas terrae]|uniref:hypothetical protein n=1 Tax=Parafilimonas terrae TaxID=1465490 RepID=UPI0015A5FA8E|nr:hypothetical protein [Parafilimonas terrae]
MSSLAFACRPNAIQRTCFAYLKYRKQAYVLPVNHQFNPIEKIVELYRQKIELYERMLKEKNELIDKLMKERK